MPADYEVQIEGLDELITKNLHLQADLPKVIRDMLETIVHKTQDKVLHNVPVDGGRLQSSIAEGAHISPELVPTWAVLKTDVIYARQREYGGVIKARNAPYLWFKSKKGWARTKAVYQEGAHYMRKGLEQSLGDVDAAVDEAKKAIEGYWE